MAGYFNRMPSRPGGGEIHIDATDARQANWGQHAFWMLICSIALVVIGMFGAWAYWSTNLSETDARAPPAAADSSRR